MYLKSVFDLSRSRNRCCDIGNCILFHWEYVEEKTFAVLVSLKDFIKADYKCTLTSDESVSFATLHIMCLIIEFVNILVLIAGTFIHVYT